MSVAQRFRFMCKNEGENLPPTVVQAWKWPGWGVGQSDPSGQGEEGLDKVAQVAPWSAVFSLPDLLMSCGVQIASFPGLPHFLFFGFPSVCPSTNSCAINDRASCLPVKSSTVDQSCEPQESWLSSERSMMKSSALFERGPLPPYVHLASTRRHSCDRCSQAFPVFRALPLLCIILNKNRRTKKRGRPGNEANGQIDGYGIGHHMTRKVVSHIQQSIW